MALDCDGVDDQIDHGDIPGVDLAAALTLMFWQNPDVLVVNDGISNKGAAWENRSGGADSSIPDLVIGGTNIGALPTGALTAGTWKHYAWVFDGAGVGNSGRLQGYIDAVNQTLTFTGTIPAALSDGAANGVDIGSNGGSFHDGKFALVKIWTAALTAAEVAQEMNSYRPVRTVNLVLWAPYDDGTDARDYSGSANHGTVTGALQVAGPPLGYGFPILVS